MRTNDPTAATTRVSSTPARGRTRRTFAAAGVAAVLLTAASPAVALADAGTATTLNFTEQTQEQDQWCWAATGLSVAQYLGYGQGTSQESFCESARGLSAGPCPNQSAELTVVQNGWRQLGMGAGVDAGGSLGFDTVKDEINGNRPIETGVYWTAGGGHARVIYGYDATTGTVLFSDPWPSSDRYQEMAYDSYVSNSQFRWADSIYQVGM